MNADPVHLSIYTVSGAEALQIDENLAPVPGGASASVWKVYVPAPEPLRADVTEAATQSAHLSAEDPPVGVVRAAAENGSLIDFGALAQRLREGER